MSVDLLITVMMAVVVGVNLVPVTVSSIEEMEGTGLSNLLNILPIVLATVVLLGGVAWLGFSGGESEERPPNKVVVILKSYMKEHRKFCSVILVTGVLMLLLYLSTCIGIGKGL